MTLYGAGGESMTGVTPDIDQRFAVPKSVVASPLPRASRLRPLVVVLATGLGMLGTAGVVAFLVWWLVLSGG
ncbi:hypothetical protein LCGC14_1933630 [marine sediment metagenome]|uniref:Uncharacterized protein n=1 Tax=marine sediment metagenome TaxID=412755 RepID=A0A0F9FMD4_9ZZZZ